jgi:hypothetical protein
MDVHGRNTIRLPDGTIVSGDDVILKTLPDGSVTITLPAGRVTPPVDPDSGRIPPPMDFDTEGRVTPPVDPH